MYKFDVFLTIWVIFTIISSIVYFGACFINVLLTYFKGISCFYLLFNFV